MEKTKPAALGFFLVFIGLAVNRLLVLRPNRILAGENVSSFSVLGSWFIPLLLLCIVLFLLLIKWKRANIMYTAVFVAALLFLYVTGSIGIWSRAMISEAGTARISPSFGYWLFVSGILVIIVSSPGSKGAKFFHYFSLLLIPAGLTVLFWSGLLDGLSLVIEYRKRADAFGTLLISHIMLVLLSTMAAVVAGVPVGYLVVKKRQTERPVLFFIHLAQTFPTLSLLALLMIPLAFLVNLFPPLQEVGIRATGFFPVSLVLFLYALLPVTAATMAGFTSLAPALLETARGLGLNRLQVLAKVELPLAFPIILGGIRTAVTQNIGNAIIAGLVGGGGMGVIIFLGLSQAEPDLVLAGILPLLALAILFDRILILLIKITIKNGSIGNRNTDLII
jgi:osmoprotectant transport system permease protein